MSAFFKFLNDSNDGSCKQAAEDIDHIIRFVVLYIDISHELVMFNKLQDKFSYLYLIRDMFYQLTEFRHK